MAGSCWHPPRQYSSTRTKTTCFQDDANIGITARSRRSDSEGKGEARDHIRRATSKEGGTFLRRIDQSIRYSSRSIHTLAHQASKSEDKLNCDRKHKSYSTLRTATKITNFEYTWIYQSTAYFRFFLSVGIPEVTLYLFIV